MDGTSNKSGSHAFFVSYCWFESRPTLTKLFNPMRQKQFTIAITKTLTLVISCFMIASCSSSKNTQSSYRQSNAPGSPFGEVYEAPASEHDTDEYFGATGIAYGSKANMDILQLNALTNAQNAVRQKMKHSYKGLVSDYANSISNNGGTDIQSKVERGGDQIIDAIVNETQASKGPMFSAVDEKGNVTCFIGIRVYKNVVADKIADYVSEDEELKIRFKEDEFRKRIKEAFKDYKEGQK